MSENKKYVFRGSVKQFDRLIATGMTATSMAPTKAKAKSNIIFRLKQRLGLDPKRSKIELVGDIIEVKGDEENG